MASDPRTDSATTVEPLIEIATAMSPLTDPETVVGPTNDPSPDLETEADQLADSGVVVDTLTDSESAPLTGSETVTMYAALTTAVDPLTVTGPLVGAETVADPRADGVRLLRW